MKLLNIKKTTSIFSLLIIFLGCKKAGQEVLENAGKNLGKETIETSAELGTKTIIKSFSKEEIKDAIINNGLNQNVLKKVLQHLSNKEATLFVNDLKYFELNFSKLNKSPDLIIAYKKLITSESHRTNISYLYQTENWIKKGSKGDLILEVPNNINKKILGEKLNEIPFINKIIRFEGLNLSIIVPDFSKYNVYRAPKIKALFYKSPDKIQFEICRANLRKQYLENSKKIEELLMIQNKRFAANGGILSDGRYITDPLEMLEKQKKDILQEYTGNQQGRIFGFVWHHNEDVGVIDLVAYDKHNSVKHIGGRNIWGGGSIARK